MKTGEVDHKLGWRFAAVPHCKAAVAESRLYNPASLTVKAPH